MEHRVHGIGAGAHSILGNERLPAGYERRQAGAEEERRRRN